MRGNSVGDLHLLLIILVSKNHATIPDLFCSQGPIFLPAAKPAGLVEVDFLSSFFRLLAKFKKGPNRPVWDINFKLYLKFDL